MISELGNSISSTLQDLFRSRVDDEAIETAIKNICTSLIKSNANPKLVANLRTRIKEQLQKEKVEANANRAKIVQKVFFNCLVRFLDPGTKSYEIQKGKNNVVVFVGLQGCGKTTSICKYANYHKRRGFRVGIVCADTFRAGAFDQIKQNASKIGVPYFGSADPDPVRVAREGVSKFRKNDFELILVDTSGRHTQEDALFMEMKELVEAISPDNIVFVVDAGIGQSAEEQAAGFKNAVGVGGILLTKMDGASKAGGALSSVAAAECPIDFVGTGEGMEDIERFDAGRFVGKMLGMGDMDGFIERLSVLEIDQEDVVKRLSGGKFRLIDFKNIFTQLMALGPMGKMLEMIPGLGGVGIPDETKLKRITYMFDSMSRDELESNGDVFQRCPGRVERVSRGSGTSKEHVSEMLSDFRQMSLMLKKLIGNPMFAQMLQGTMDDKSKQKLMKDAKGKIPSKVFDYFDALN